MVSGTSVPTPAGAGHPGPTSDGGEPPLAGGSESLRGVEQGDARSGVEGRNGQDAPRPDGAAPDRTEGGGNQSKDPRDQGPPRSKVSSPSRTAGNKRFTKTEIGIALREAEGNVRLAAAALDCSELNVRHWITNDVELNALYGGVTPGSEKVVPPTEPELLARDLDTTPTGVPTNGQVNMALAVAEVDAEILRKGLKEMGVSDSTLERLKKLDGLAQSNGHFLSISLQTTHRSYFFQTIQLTEVAEQLKKRYLDDMIAPDGHPEAGKVIANINCSSEERATFYKVYTEMVKEGGRAYQVMMEGTQAMVKMLTAASGKDNPTGAGSGKPGWKRSATRTPGRRG